MTDELLEHIAHLFYAIAKADKKLSFEEYVTLTEVLERNWQHIDDTNILLIRNTFNALQKQNALSELCFNKFIAYLQHNPKYFTEELKSLILKTANKIAYAFAGINKSELTYMAKLSLEFK
ncbi:hypothetical protein [uncultured Winogradskyella sp.]|uniref:hypothetical protein n=1 Tax=uncultured Winogradskyella sp. TaxID=395353 RepID=UPI00263077D4|nr:hypothetical protein [uncultured Winogradskyella sp.]